MGPLAIAGIGAGINLAGNLIGKIGQGKRERRAWNRQNEYNHPKAQMERLKQAGLNPHLVYGQNVSGATGQAQQQHKVPEAEFGSVGSDWMHQSQQAAAVDQSAATVANLKIQNDVLKAEILQKQAQTALNLSQVDKTVLDTTLLRRTMSDLVEQVSLTNRSISAGTDKTRADIQKIDADIKHIAKQNNLTDAQVANLKADLRIKKEQVANMIQERNYKGVLIKMQELEYRLLKMGVNKNDPYTQRIMKEILDDTGAIDAIKKHAPSVLKEIWRHLTWPSRL